MRVSVIIPVYNAAEFVTQAVDSALGQPETGQVILVEDGSADGSLDACRSLVRRHGTVRVLQHPGGGNRGPGASRNLGIAAAGCEYTAFLDADDYYLPGRFREPKRIMSSDSTIDGVYEAVGTVYENDCTRKWYEESNQPELMTISEPVAPDALFDVLLDGTKGWFCTDGIVVRTSLFRQTGGFDTSLRMGEDTAMWLKMAAMARLTAGSIDKPVSMRRLHGANTIYRLRDAQNSFAPVWSSLLRWARSTGVPRRHQLRLLNGLLNFSWPRVERRRGYVYRKAQDLRFLVGFGIRNPLAWRSRLYRRQLTCSLGGRRLGLLQPDAWR